MAIYLMELHVLSLFHIQKVMQGTLGKGQKERDARIANTKPIKRMNEVAYYADHNNDPSLSERIARIMALMEINLETTK